MNMFIKVTLYFLFNILLLNAFAQVENHVHWKTSYIVQPDSTIIVEFKATIDDKWHLYSYDIGEGPILPLTINIKKTSNFTELKKIYSKNKGISFYDTLMQQQVKYFEKEALFYYTIKAKKFPLEFNGYINYMQCDDEKCLPPRDYDFSLTIQAPDLTVTKKTEFPVKVDTPLIEGTGEVVAIQNTEITPPIQNKKSSDTEKMGWLLIF
ncbi:MAG: protein-disulfide reductase DsbD domain-containing protein, partial [Bacteroidales bacterium]